MRILSAKVENFGSYKELELSFTDQGLTLISGSTGSGKSTICDIVPWILFGKTAKDGAVDEIRPWQSTSTTKGTVKVEINNIVITIERSRGPNDLFFLGQNDIEPTRGKDLADTQKMINKALGIDIEAYLLSSYFHEFSYTSSFFTASAKNRRQITENIVDLSLASKLQESAGEYRKKLTAELERLNNEKTSLSAVIKQTNNVLYSVLNKQKAWNIDHLNRLEQAKSDIENFKTNKSIQIKELQADYVKKYADFKERLISLQLEDVEPETLKRASLELKRRENSLKDTLCPTCGNHIDNTARLVLSKDLGAYNLAVQKNQALKAQIINIEQRITSLETNFRIQLDIVANTPDTTRDELARIKDEVNPHNSTVSQLENEVKVKSSLLNEVTEDLNLTSEELSDLKMLNRVIDEFRGTLITNTLKQIETNTNTLLTTHFDAEIKVSFLTKEADKIEVEIFKDGNLASYTQLSKGQRQLLKLTFAISIMRSISDLVGITVNTMFFDEALDGLDSELKLKAFGLLQELALDHEAIYVVEHSQDLKLFFTNQLNVTLKDGFSSIE